MTMRAKVQAIAIGCSLIAVGLVVDGWFQSGLVVNEAQARIGRPMTPGSAAGVARRTTRRTIRRSNRYVATLPRGCTKVNIDGTVLSHCGGTYYQAHGGRYVVVYVD
ncbi:hypothetical protein ACFL9T_14495 [Thermodesulfobacteriota bacterium]